VSAVAVGVVALFTVDLGREHARGVGTLSVIREAQMPLSLVPHSCLTRSGLLLLLLALLHCLLQTEAADHLELFCSRRTHNNRQ
jgi:hypothetical protein